MDKGAHYFKCDFQVHSPRDIAWTGKKIGVEPDEMTDLSEEQIQNILDERIQFAKEYLEKIRNVGLNAIAITDHHDVTFSKIIRAEALRQNTLFIENEDIEKIITVFPGIELSLVSPAAQAIIIFDSDFDDTHLDAVLNLLGGTPSSPNDKNTCKTERISQDIIGNLVDLHKKLNEVAYCKGRYIVLPNITKGGSHSILRTGFHEHYRKMPCVGGYVDKAISDDSGYQNKVNGGDINYGNKSVGIISTSDNRYEDGREFGNYYTWIKWAEPTAEAIRQACLAKESRISQENPELPQVFIESIDVTNSKFLGSFKIMFNQQYNALIGGRGTGKSTVLEYLRWSLSDQTSINIDSEELTVIDKRRKALIKNTLTDIGGEIRLTMIKNGIPHIVKKSSTTNITQLKIDSNPFEQVNEEDIRRILPVQSYSQKQLSNVGVKTEELKRFIDKPIQDELSTISYKLNETKTKLKEAYSNYVRKMKILLEKENIQLDSKSLHSRVESIRKSLKGISGEGQDIIAKKSIYETEGRIINKSVKELELFEGKADELIELLGNYPEEISVTSNLENDKLVKEITDEINIKFDEIKTAVKSLKNIFSDKSLSKLSQKKLQWEEIKNKFEVSYKSAKENSQASESQLMDIQKIEYRISQTNNTIAERDSILKEIGKPEDDFHSLKHDWNQLHKEKIELLNNQAHIFSDLSKGVIKAEVTKHIDFSEYKRKLKNILEGSRIREEKIEAICSYILQSEDSIQAYTLVNEELRELAELKLSEDKSNEIPETPILTECGFSQDHKLKLCKKLNTDNWILLTTDELDFIPQFEYTTNLALDERIEFSEASAGQQATALLTVLLNQPGIPLLIDQPEDDIDNRAINSIIENIWDAKKKRQLVFTSHNANLVVNGDAELVICCDYKDTTSQTRGIIKKEGAIDNREVKKEITSVMEGGEKAFILRKDKYGF